MEILLWRTLSIRLPEVNCGMCRIQHRISKEWMRKLEVTLQQQPVNWMNK